MGIERSQQSNGGEMIALILAGMILTGKASWYDSKSACKYNPDPKCPTASGRSLYALEKEETETTNHFAASWDFPFGARIKVTNVRTGKYTVFTVWDRGPSRKLHNRIVDLSCKGFQEIADPKEGIIPVIIEVIN